MEKPFSSVMDADYTDGKTAALKRVRLAFSETDGRSRWSLFSSDQDHVGEGHPFAEWDFSTVHLERTHPGSDEVILHHESGAQVSVRSGDLDPRILHALERSFSARLGARGRAIPAGRRRAILYALALAVIAGFYLGMPSLSRILANRVPVSWERRAGEELVGSLTGADAAAKPGPATAALTKIVARLRPPAGSPGAELEYRAVLWRDPMVNAFATPGGIVLVTCGLVKQAESADEIAGVLAHELEHVIRRHVLAGIIRTSAFTALWSFSVGDYSGMLAVDPQTLFQIAALRFSRDDEAEADRGAMRILRDAGVSSRGLATFFTRLQKGEPAFLKLVSTHPASAERAKLLAEDASSTGPATRAVLEPAEWAELKKACE